MVTLKKPVLRIVRGKAQYPLRAVDSEQFLVGAGNCCHLQLSAGEIPMIFAILQSHPEGCQIEAMHPHPALLVNGVPRRTALLLPGDRLAFGPYELEFLLDVQEHEFRAVTPETPLADRQPFGSIIPAVPQCVRDLTAEELVDCIERELALLEELGHFDDPALDPGLTTDMLVPRKTA